MAENSAIEWTTHTFNPWRGCTKVSAGCAHCYAETLSGRNPGTLGVWGPNGTRVVASEAMWREPVKWNREAECTCGWNDGGHAWDCPQADERPRVFCASLADVFEDWKGPISTASGHYARKQFDGSWITDGTGGVTRDDFPLTIRDVRTRLFRLIDATPNLDWLLLTKRPENITKHLEDALILAQGGDPSGKCFFADHGEEEPKNSTANMLNEWIAGDPPKNVWLGVSVENQAAADARIPHLLSVPAAVRFLSCEPLLGPVDLSRVGKSTRGNDINAFRGTVTRYQSKARNDTECSMGVSCQVHPPETGKIGWVIVGGESGPGARPCRVEWIRSIVEQCKAAGVACFVKQMGSFVVDRNDRGFDAESEVFADGPNAGQPTDSQAWPNAWMDVEHNINGFREQYQGADCRVHLRDKKGGDMSEWPADLRVREFPGAKGDRS